MREIGEINFPYPMADDDLRLWGEFIFFAFIYYFKIRP